MTAVAQQEAVASSRCKQPSTLICTRVRLTEGYSHKQSQPLDTGCKSCCRMDLCVVAREV